MHDFYNLAPLLLILATILLGIVFNQQGLNRVDAKIDRLDAKIEKVQADLTAKIERVQSELTIRIDRMQADMVEFYKIQAAQGTKVESLWDDRRKS